jgi:SAM-dependent methyltransferase
MEHNFCPNCKGSHIEGFFKIKNAPIYSLVTVKTKEEALKVPRKDIELAFCHSCGFIFNRLFDTSIDYFSMGYEDQQGFSNTFMQYLKRISNELIEKYSLQGKTFIEIGCGKGDFTNLLAQLSGGKGIGIDPAYEEGRQTNPNLIFHKELYSPKHGHIDCDLICCRHTLEHIHNTNGFFSLLRESLGQSRKPALFFEVPQINRILDDLAFWDIYYEHCSYFSPSSFAKLLRLTGFDVLDLRIDYNDQYLLVEAIPTTKPKGSPMLIEEGIDVQKYRIDRFRTKIAAQLKDWHHRLSEMKKDNKKVAVWGGGSKSVGFLTNFSDLNLIPYVVDINPYMENNYIPGIGSKYVQPVFLKELSPDVVIIMNQVYEKEITKTLSDMGLYPEIYSL